MKLHPAGLAAACRLFFVGLALALISTAVLSTQTAWAQTEPEAAPKTKIFLAMVGFEVTSAATPTPACQTTPQAEEFVVLMRTDENQQRPALVCDQRLTDVAQARAKDMADRGYFDHVNPDGYGPNYLVRNAGYVLPKFYSQENNSNNIESIAAGYATVAEAWEALKNSEAHRRHLLGEEQFYAEQTEYGIGYVYVEQSEFKYYWVVITARQASATD